MSTAGLSKMRLGRMHDVMTGYVERGEVPGLVTLVSRRGEVHVDAIGTRAIADSTPMRRDTIFRISSMTKPITAAATMILVEECKVRLDEPVDRWLPELAERQVLKRLDGPLDDTVPANRPITVRDLLTFRMGFGQMMAPPITSPPERVAYPILQAASEQQIGMGPPSPSSMPAPDEWIRRLGQLPLMHQPGERWMYNTGSDVLGVLLARASGQPLETFLRERLFEPLEMRDTGFSVPAASLDQLTTEQKAASSLISGFLDGNGWGFGVSVVTRRDDIAAVPGRYGWDGGLGTSWYSDPREEMVIILMTQSAWASPSPPNVYFWTLAYQAIDD